MAVSGIAIGKSMLVHVKTTFGRTCELLVRNDWTIKELKSLIEGEVSIPVRDQCIIFNGLQLQDNETIWTYNIIPSSTIFLVRRTRATRKKLDNTEESEFPHISVSKHKRSSNSKIKFHCPYCELSSTKQRNLNYHIDKKHLD